MVEAQSVKPLKALTISFTKPPNLTHLLTFFKVKFCLAKATVGFIF